MSEFVNSIDILGDNALTDAIIDRSITEYKDDVVPSIGAYAFSKCKKLTTVDLPAATTIDTYAFYACAALTTVNLPAVTSIKLKAFTDCGALMNVNIPAANSIGESAFQNCRGLTTVEIHSATSIGKNAFYYCQKLTTVDLHAATSINNNVFQDCTLLDTLILRNTSQVATLSSTSSFWQTKIESGKGYIYVPAALLDSYKASIWGNFGNQLRVIEDWSVDGTVTGELDIKNRRMVRFFNDDGTLLGYKVVTVGSDATFKDPIKEGEYQFTGWNPAPANVTADMDCYAQFKSTALVYKKLVERTIAGDFTDNLATSAGDFAFNGCKNLTYVCLPKATSVGKSAFLALNQLTYVDLPMVTSIGQYAFRYSTALVTLILRNTSQVASLYDSFSLSSTPIANKAGFVYVPAALVDEYKAANYWDDVADQIRAIEDYPEICGGE